MILLLEDSTEKEIEKLKTKCDSLSSKLTKTFEDLIKEINKKETQEPKKYQEE